MRMIVSDGRGLIDLRKARLLEAFVRLPFEIVIPDMLFDEELLKLNEEDEAVLMEGLNVMEGVLERDGDRPLENTISV